MEQETERCTCEEVEHEPHSCPYAEEIGDDHSDNYCTCCSRCEQECAWAI